MIQNYRTGDARLVNLQREQQMEAALYAAFFDRIHAYSLVDDCGHIKAVFGYRLDEYNHAECYALIGRDIGRLGMLNLVSFLRFEIERVMQTQKIKCAMMTVKKGFQSATRLAKILGFHFTAELPQFYLCNDYQLFTRRRQ